MFKSYFAPSYSTVLASAAVALALAGCGGQDPSFKEEKAIAASGDARTGNPIPDAHSGVVSSSTDTSGGAVVVANASIVIPGTSSTPGSNGGGGSGGSGGPGGPPVGGGTCDHPDAHGKCSCSDTNPTPPPSASRFACSTSQAITLKAGQTATLSWSHADSIESFLVAQSSTPALRDGLGSLVRQPGLAAKYTAPARISDNADISVIADSGVDLAACRIRLVGDSEIGIGDDGDTIGVKGNVYNIGEWTDKLPDFSRMTPVDSIVVSNIDVPQRAWETGFPGVRNLFEYFGIQFRGQLYADRNMQCEFKVSSDDGANLYIDGAKIVDNDGVHGVRSATGSKYMTSGSHDFRLDYYQGPRVYIAAQVFWKCGDAADFSIILPEAFRGPLQ